MKLVFENEHANIFDDSYSIKTTILLVFIFGLLIYSIIKDKGHQQFWSILIGLFFIGMILWSVLKNQIHGNKLIKFQTNLSRENNAIIIKKVTESFNLKMKLETEKQLRFIERDEYKFMDYETTLLNFEDEIYFNYRAVRKGTNLKSVFSQDVNKKQMEVFTARFEEFKNDLNRDT